MHGLHLKGTTSYYYTNKGYFGLIDIKNFYKTLECVLTNDLPIDAIQIEGFKFKKDYLEFINSYKINEIEEIYNTHVKLIRYLEKNKFKMDKQRKIEILKVWIFWISVINTFIVNILSSFIDSLKFKIYSLKNLLNNFSEILYEEANLNCCFDFQNLHFKESFINSNHIGDIYNDMMVQPDLLTRIICSQSLSNLKLLVEHGYEIDKSITYQHSKLKSPLHWAFYCDNLSIFQYLIELGFEINENDIFYDSSYKKNFKFSLYLYFLKEKNLHAGEFIYQKLKFNSTQFMTSFNLYELDLDEIVKIYEGLFDIGFCFMEKFDYVLDFDEIGFKLDRISNYQYQQLASCICQKNISTAILDYLVNKFMKLYDNDKTQIELARAFKYSFLDYYIRYFYRLIGRQFNTDGIKKDELLTIISYILPKLDQNGYTYLAEIIENPSWLFTEFMAEIFYEINNDGYVQTYLYNEEIFKIIDILNSYSLIKVKDYDELISKILNNMYFQSWSGDSKKFRSNIESFGFLLLYLIQNNFINKTSLVELNEGLLKKKSSSHPVHRPDLYEILNEFVKRIYELNHELLSLFNLTKNTVRNSIQVKSKVSLEKLDKSAHIQSLIKRETLKIKKYDFYKKLKFSFT